MFPIYQKFQRVLAKFLRKFEQKKIAHDMISLRVTTRCAILQNMKIEIFRVNIFCPPFDLTKKNDAYTLQK